LAPRYGSNLLTLRLRSLCSGATPFCDAASLRRFHGLCLARSLPAAALPLRAPSVAGVGLLAGSSRRESRLRSGLRSSSHNPLGNCVGARVETFRGPNSARARFLIAPCRSAPDSCRCPVMTPARGAGDICLFPAVARMVGESGTSCHLPFPGRPGLSQPRSRFRGPYTPRRHSSRHAKFSISWRDRSDHCWLEFVE